jgi:hypothetical protein
MSALASRTEFAGNVTAAQMPFLANREEHSMRDKLTLIFDTLLVLSLQLVFRAMHVARRLNY